MKTNRFFPKTDAVGAIPKHDRTAWLKGGEHKCQMPPRTPLGKAWRIVLIGPPGVGKGMQGEMLCERLGTCHLSTGDAFRDTNYCNRDDLTPVMGSAVNDMKRGGLVPDESVLAMVGKRLRCLNCSGGFLLDGFPRTVAQASVLEELLDSQDVKLTAVFHYELSIEQIVTRHSGRRICPVCNAVYHVTARPPKPAGVCDHCGQKLVQHEDDRPESVKVRMEAYQKRTNPLIDFYKQRGLLVSILAEGTPEEIYKRTRLLALAR